MNSNTIHIENPSKQLLEFVRKLGIVKEERKAKLLSQKDKYFNKSK